MAWNGSNINAGKKKYPIKRSLSLGQIVLIIAGILALCIFLIYCLIPSEEKMDNPSNEGSKNKISRIKDVRPNIAVDNQKVIEKEEIPYWKSASTNGLTKRQLMKWKIHHRPPAVITNDTSETEMKPAYAIFNTYVDNDLASLLTFETGSTIVGDPGYERWFTKAFLKSLETPIIVEETDTPEQAQLKKDLIALKIDLKARHDAGEDIAEIMRNAHEEFQSLAIAKEEIERSAKDLIKNGKNLTDNDIDDIISAANIMLDQKGIAPIKLGPIARRRLLRKHK